MQLLFVVPRSISAEKYNFYKVISKIKAAFARHGTADVLVSHNGQQFKSK